jgi:hypothetical protein
MISGAPVVNEALPTYEETVVVDELGVLLHEVTRVENIEMDIYETIQRLKALNNIDAVMNSLATIRQSVDRVLERQVDLVARVLVAEFAAKEAADNVLRLQAEKQEALLALDDVVEALGIQGSQGQLESASDLVLIQQIVARLLILRQRRSPEE